MTKHKVYVYGTLRPGFMETVQVPGHLYDLGWYPGVQLSNGGPDSPTVTCEVIEVDDAGLARLDKYEGCYPDSPEMSLYLRKEYEDGWIYTYNGSFDGKDRIPDGDWLKYKQMSSGYAKDILEEV